MAAFPFADRKSLLNSLKQLFSEMKKRERQTCSAAEVLKSLKWIHVKQQDVFEFAYFFINNLHEITQKIPELKDKFTSLFFGKLRNRICCVDVEHTSSSEETFFEITLPVLGCTDIYKSLDKYTCEELMDGENKYDTGKKSLQKQTAKKSVEFISTPHVLFLHLKRSIFDVSTQSYIKILDRIEYYDEINLHKYMPAANQRACKYRLHSVLVHTGSSVRSGHYYSYIRESNESWV